jgi:outer membrane protein insertion porin family
LLRRGLFEQFIFGSSYAWFYNSQMKEPGQKRNNWYVNANMDMSGNLLYLFSKAVNLEQTVDDEYRIFGKGFSQFARADIDLRYYHNLGAGQRLATRLIAGLGLPYGNSTSLPYLKLFTIGGSNSIRAFHPRSLGPGAYLPPDSLAGGFNIYQSGEMKLELSAEYRFAITPVFKGAVFADAGNIWRVSDSETAPGGVFRRSTFLGQMALGSGVGLRIDATLFVLRFDFAIPLAIPGSGNEGFFDPIQLLDRQWRRDKLVFNLAIGYPF